MKKLEVIKDMVRFSFAADAFALGYHWTYNIPQNSLQFSKTKFEIINPMGKKFHSYRTAGDISSYQDQAFILLNSLEENSGFNKKDFKNKWLEIWSKYYSDWIDRPTKITIDTGAASTSDEISPVGRISPFFLNTAETLSEKLKNVEEYISLTHNNPIVIDFGKFITHLGFLIANNNSNKNIVEDINKIKVFYPKCESIVETGLKLCDKSIEKIIAEKFPTYCEIDGSGPITIYLLINFWNSPEDAFKYNAILDGDCTARASILATIFGLNGVYPSFAKKWFEHLKIKNDLNEILNKFKIDRWWKHII